MRIARRITLAPYTTAQASRLSRAALRNSPPTASTVQLQRGVEWAGFVAEQLGTGAWTTDPSHPATAEQDVRLAARLRTDLDAIEFWLNAP